MFEKINKLEKWKKQRLILTVVLYLLVCIVYLALTCGYLLKDNNAQKDYWKEAKTENSSMMTEINKIGKANDTPVVTTGTYVENVRDIDLKNNSFDAVMVVWFRWTGHDDLDLVHDFRIYKAELNSVDVMFDYKVGNVNYQKARIHISVSKNYWTPRFPLDTQQLRIYLEPNERCDTVILKPDAKNSTINGNMDIPGYNITGNGISVVPIEYTNNQNDPAFDKDVIKTKGTDNQNKIKTTEIMTSLNLVRNGWGTYIKCFVALFATLIWIMIMLYLATVHEIDPLGMIPAAFFGAVSNILVGANLLPDALETGLIEFVNIWGIMNILLCAMMIISINSIRNRFDERGFARVYGRIVFVMAAVTIVTGNVLLPLVCVI